MSLIRASSPHNQAALTTPKVMRLVLLALLPGLLAQLYFFGWGVVINLIWASLVALAAEALVLRLRGRPLQFYLGDASALVTAWLLALALPPLLPWWVTLIGVSFAIIFGKQLYGGMGYNPFNPAMLGYVLLLISFPGPMTQWLPATGTPGYAGAPGLLESLATIFPFTHGINVDAYSMATPLDVVRENKSLTMTELWQNKAVLSGMAGIGWIWVNLAYLLGGLFLLWKRLFSWHGPVGFLAAIAIMSTLFYGGDSSASHGSPLFHLLSGATMLGAFFIITDPVSGASSNRGRLIFGLGAGVLVYIIRAWGGYPDGVAFATLLMNMAAPMIDYYTQPRTFGHSKPNKGPAKSE